MASSSKDPSLISDPQEHKWVIEISEILNRQLEINVETPSVSLFQVPKTTTTKKPEAYEPQQIGLGPIHHFRPEPYKKMEQKKLGVMRRVLQGYEIKDFKVTVVDKVEQLVPVVRSCYDVFLQDEDKSLAWVFAIDGLFLLNLFHTYNSPVDKEKEEYLLHIKEGAYNMKRIIRDDFLSDAEEELAASKAMSEKCIEEKIESADILSSIGPQTKSDQVNLESVIDKLIESEEVLHPLLRQKEILVTEENYIEWEEALRLSHHEPELPKVGLKKRLVAQDILMLENQIPFMVLKEIDEALHRTSSNSFSTSTHRFSPFVFRTFCEIHSPLELYSNAQAPSSVEHVLHYMYYSIVNNVMQQAAGDQKIDGAAPSGPSPSFDESWYRAGKSPLDNLYNFVSKIPKKEIVQAYEQTISILETFSQSKSLVPSASKLHVEAGFEFDNLEKYKGIQNIDVCEKKIYLPRVTLNNDSEVVLRNLVAYETIAADSDSNFPLTEYMGFMCALIMNVDDVKLLKDQNVIKGDLREDEIAQLFIGMRSSIPTVKTKEKSKLRKTIDEINKVYESRLKMKIYLLLKKLAHSLLVVLKAVGGFVEASWKIVAFMVSIVTVFLLTSQAYCDTYGCVKMTATLLPYASS